MMVMQSNAVRFIRQMKTVSHRPLVGRGAGGWRYINWCVPSVHYDIMQIAVRYFITNALRASYVTAETDLCDGAHEVCEMNT